jgi:hypothetical protein
MRFILVLAWIQFFLTGLTAHATTQSGWTLNFDARDEAQSNRLPVLMLGKPGWSQHHVNTNSDAYAWRSWHLGSNATHDSGWSLGYLVRGEAELSANSDAVKVAALMDQKTDPASVSSYALSAQQKIWQGRGLQIQTPDVRISSTTLLALRFQWLELSRFDTGQLRGITNYLGSGEYDFDLTSTRTGYRLQSPFLDSPAAHGWGGSIGFALNATPHPRLQATLQARDLVSILRWRTGHEQSTLNSNIQSRDAQGYLNYAAAVNGQREVRHWNDRMTADWRADMSWQLQSTESNSVKGHITLEAQQKAHLQQYWLGWASQRLHSRASDLPAWRMATAPASRALMAEIQHQGWHLTWRGDSFHETARLRSLYAGWRTHLN